MRRHLLTILICLLLGAVVNVAVAWGCSLRIRELSVLKDRDTQLERKAESVWLRYAERGWPPAPTGHFFTKDENGTSLGGTREIVRFGVTDLLLLRSQVTGMTAESWSVREVRAGWPLRSFRAGFRGNYGNGGVPIKTALIGGFHVTVGTHPDLLRIGLEIKAI